MVEKIKCTYRRCEGLADPVVADTDMRPFHRECASRALAEYNTSDTLIAFLMGAAMSVLLCLVAGMIFGWK